MVKVFVAFDFLEKAARLVFFRRRLFFAACGKISAKTCDIGQPAPGKNTAATGEILAEGVDDVGYCLIVGGGGDNDRRLAFRQGGFCPEAGDHGKQQGGFAGARRAIDGEDVAMRAVQ